MDASKYYDARHRLHLYCNPMNKEKLERFIRLLRLKPGMEVLDIACGKGEFLIRLAELYSIRGVGVDISPYCIRDALNKLEARAPNAQIRFLLMDAKDYKPEHGQLFDLSACMGASWIYGGHRGTLRALRDMTKVGGIIVVGEPYWLKEPDPEYLAADSLRKQDYACSHRENIEIGEDEGLTCIYTIVSDHDDWDHYETLGWWSIDEYARENPDDPDLLEILAREEREKKIYLKWGRDTMGWAIYAFRKRET